jgi:hypothetical protein
LAVRELDKAVIKTAAETWELAREWAVVVVAVVSAAEEFSDALVTTFPETAVSTIVVRLAFGWFHSVDHRRHPDVRLRLRTFSCGGLDSAWSFIVG